MNLIAVKNAHSGRRKLKYKKIAHDLTNVEKNYIIYNVYDVSDPPVDVPPKNARCSCMLPNDPIMLMSVINTKLRDTYPSLEELCGDMDISCEELTRKLEQAGYVYFSNTNSFRKKAYDFTGKE